MECKQVQEELVALIDGALPPAQAAEIRQHLASCPACAAQAAQLEKAVALTRQASGPAPALSPDFHHRFWNRFQREKKRSFFDITAYLPRWALAVSAAAATVLVAGWFVWTSSRPRVTDEEEVLASHLELFSDYEAINLMELLQDFEVIEMLDEKG